MNSGFNLSAYLEASTKASGVPLKVKHRNALKHLGRLLRKSVETGVLQLSVAATFRYPPQNARTAQVLEAKRSAEMVAALPDLIGDASLHPVARQACVESFFTHVRGLIEFLRIRPTNKTKDFSASDVVPNFKPGIDEAAIERLKEYWRDTNSHVVHFSTDRAAS